MAALINFWKPLETNKIAIFADKTVGMETVQFLLQYFENDVEFIVCVNSDSIIFKDYLKRNEQYHRKVLFNNDLSDERTIDLLKRSDLKYIILAWWPFIIKEPIISIPRIGILNFHPSLLPFDKGKNYNFWTIVEGSPFGVTIHFVDNSIDGGDIIFQQEIPKSWEDTGESLYEKAQFQMVDLFKNCYAKIRAGEYVRKKQDPNEGSFHRGKELDNASFIELDKSYVAKDLLNVLRARTFPPYPGAWFEFDGARYEIRIEITRILKPNHESN